MVPQVKPTDTEDVSWALSTAQTSFGRGDVHEALKWLRRAAEAASEAEQDDRALELAKAAAALTEKAGASRPPPPPASSRPASAIPPRPPASAPRPPSVSPPRPAAGVHGLTGARSSPSTAPKAPSPALVAPPAEKKARRKSIPPDDAADRVHLPPATDEPPVTPRTAPEEKKSRRKSRDDLARPSAAEELEAMATQTMQGHELPEFEEGGSTKVGTPALRATLAAERGALPIMAAARVHLVKGPDGVVRISIVATENSVPVMVVPIEPGTDLSKLLG